MTDRGRIRKLSKTKDKKEKKEKNNKEMDEIEVKKERQLRNQRKVKELSGGKSSGNENFNDLIEQLEKDVIFRDSKFEGKSIYNKIPFQVPRSKWKIDPNGKTRVLYIVDMQYGFCEYRDVENKQYEIEFQKVNNELNARNINSYNIQTWNDEKISNYYRVQKDLDGNEKPLPGGTFCVSGSSQTVNNIVRLIDQLNNNNKLRIVISRDYHPDDHCSFSHLYGKPNVIVNPDGFPPHCVMGTFESSIHYTLYEKIKQLIKDGNHGGIYLVLKGINTNIESFGVHEYHESKYPLKFRQLSCFSKYQTCNKNNEQNEESSCGTLLNGGGYLVQLDLDNVTKYLLGTINKKEFISKRLVSFVKHKKYNDLVNQNNIHYVCGLAADFCVKDTAINLATHLPEKCKIYVVDTATVYASLPFVVLKNIPIYTSKLYLNFMLDNHRVIGTDYYIFDNNGKKITSLDYLKLKESFHLYRLKNPLKSIENVVIEWLNTMKELDFYKLYLSNAFDILHDYHRYGVQILKEF